MRVNVWRIARKRKRGTMYAIRWRDPSTGRMRCESCGPDKQLARRLVEQKRVELRAGHLGEAVRAPYDAFVGMVLQKLEQKERAAATIREVEAVLRRFGAICDPAGVASITTQMIDRYDAARRRGYRLCSDRSCRWSNVAEATTWGYRRPPAL